MNQKKEKTIEVKVERSFLLDGKPTKVGRKLTLPLEFAMELKASNKVSYAGAAAAAVSKGGDEAIDPADGQ